MKNRMASVIGSVMFSFLIVAIIGAAILFATNTSNEKSVFGFRFYNVLTPSMTPTIPVGSMVLVKRVEPVELREGDIVTYSTSLSGSVVVTHRINRVILSEDGLTFITKGDANQVEDINPISASQIIGKVNLIIPHFGSVIAYVQRNLWLVIGSIIALLLIGEFLSYWLSSRNKLKI